MMDRVEEAVLAFIGSCETCGLPAPASKLTGYLGVLSVHNLACDGMVKIIDDKLTVTIKGWKFLDSRPELSNVR